MLNKINNLSRRLKIRMLIFIDSISVIFSLFLSFLIRFSLNNFIENILTLLLISTILIPLVISTLYIFNLYKKITRFGGLEIFKSILFGSIFGGLILASIFYFGNFKLNLITISEPSNFARTVPILFSLLLILNIISSRYVIKVLIDYLNTRNEITTNVAVFGRTSNLIKLASILEDRFSFKVSLFISDSKDFIGTELNKIKVIDINNINNHLNKLIKFVIIADLPENQDQKSFILDKLSSTNIYIKKFNYKSSNSLTNFNSNIFSDIDIGLLLSREKQPIDYQNIKSYIKNKNIVVTGGGGSIGTELCIQLLKFQINHLYVLDSSEFNLFNVKQKLTSFVNVKEILQKISFKLINICDEKDVQKFFSESSINIVYHAAAYKHVTFGKDNFFNIFKNNVLGTKNLLEYSISKEVSKFILVSSDKATDPANVMGLTKFLSEKLCDQYSKKHNNIVISKVRFGNVLDTSGSVIPIFKKQIENGGPVTVSDKNVTRYFMTKEESVELILQSSLIAKSNELFFLDMGKPVKIYNVAKTMINLMGKKFTNKNKDNNAITIIFKGLEKGEKMHEKIHNGNIEKTSHKRIYISKKNQTNDFSTDEKLVNEIIKLIKSDNNDI